MPDIKELVKQLGLNQEEVFKANHALLQIVTRASAPGNESQRTQVAHELAAELNAKTPPRKDDKGSDVPPQLVHHGAVRNRVARLLSYVAGAEEIPALIEAIGDLEVREMARFALDFTSGDDATKALIRAFDEVGPIFRVGVIHALAKRQSPEALAALKKAAAEDGDDDVRIAAVEALAYYPAPANDELMANATQKGHYRNRGRANKARVRLAETIRKSGNVADAAKIYQAIQSSNAEPAQKAAAEIGLKLAQG